MSPTGPGHGAWSDAVGAYVLGALPPEECVGFEAHMADCPACRHDVADLQVAADALPVSVPPVVPPPTLKDRIMAVVESEAALLAAAGERADRPATAPGSGRERRRGAGRFAGWTLRPWLVAACAALLLVAGGVAGAVVAGGGGEVTTVAATVDSEQAPDARVQLQVRDDGGTLVVDGMPQPPAGRVYQVWLQRPGRDPEPTAALFDVRRDGAARVAVPGSLDGVEAVLVTDEPRGGARVPSKPPVITAQPA
jgi:anti-sigma-K factor RskA